MEMNSEKVRAMLPACSLQDFDDIVIGRSLGASNHIKMISNMYVAIAENQEEKTARASIEAVGTFFKETRGKSSYAIVVALKDIEGKIGAQDPAAQDPAADKSRTYADAVRAAREAYFREADEHMDKILLYADRLMKDAGAVMSFDYSSTVEKAIIHASHKLDVYIPESRVINGGYPFVKGIVGAGHRVHFVADAAMLTVLDKIDMVFIGAETFYPDGTAFNTVGSDILAELCRTHHVPYYVLTPLLKGDIRALYGIYKETLTKDLRETMAAAWPEDLRAQVDFNSVELVGVAPEFITGYVTEKGILKTGDLLRFIYEEDQNA